MQQDYFIFDPKKITKTLKNQFLQGQFRKIAVPKTIPALYIQVGCYLILYIRRFLLNAATLHVDE